MNKPVSAALQYKTRILAAVLAFALSSGIAAGEAPDLNAKFAFQIRPQTLATALIEFSKQTQLQVMSTGVDLAQRKTAGLTGRYTISQALSHLLANTNLEYTPTGPNTIAVTAIQQKTSGQIPLTAPGGRVTQPGEETLLARNEGEVGREDPMALARDRDEAQASSEEPKDPAEIEVTGSRIKRTDLEGPSPVLTIGRQEIDRMGATEVDDVLRRLTVQYAGANENSPRETASPGYNGISLRGLGSQATLVLINGRRPGNSALISSTGAGVNINSIPLAAVERIEILTDGASAIYGTDAIAGVVNFILKQDYRGSEANVRYGNAFESDTGEKSASLTQGFGSGRTNGLFTVSVYDRNALRQQDRDFSLDAFALTFDRGSPATIYSIDGSFLPGVGTPAALVPADWDNSRPLTPADLIPYTGTQSGYGRNQAEFGFLRAPSQRRSFMGTLNYDLGRGANLVSEVSVANTTSHSELSASGITRTNAAVIGIDNPHNPFRGITAVDFNYNFNHELGPLVQGIEFIDCRYVLGVQGIGLFGASIDIDHSYSRSDSAYSREEPDQTRLLANTGTETNPALAFNFFTNPLHSIVNTPQQIQNLLGTATIDTEARLSVTTLKANRQMYRLPAGMLAIAAGVELRKEFFTQLSQNVTSAPPSSVVGNRLNRDVEAAFAELVVPLFGSGNARTGLQKLELQLAGRYEEYSDFGSSTDPKIAVAWKPLPSLLLRGAFGTGFRSPNAQELGIAGRTGTPSTATLVDIKRGNAIVAVPQMLTPTILAPEESETTTLGLVWEMPMIRGLSVSADLYRIELTGQIRGIPSQEFVNSEDFLPGRVIRGPLTEADRLLGYTGGPIQQLLLTVPINIGQTIASGADFRFAYERGTAVGQFAWNLNATYVDSYRVRVSGAAPFVESAGTGNRFGASGSRFVGNSSLFWQRNALEAGITARYIAPYRFVTPAQQIDSSLEFDLQFSVDGPYQTRFTVGANNVLRTDPPLVRSLAGSFAQPGYDVAYFNGTAGYYYVNLRKEF